MANLASMIMEGSVYGFSRANLTHTYDHEDGACLIAMESAEALRDIFEAEFYIPNSCTIQAAMEGASCVEESSQAAIMEASIKGAFTKIKEFFIKLKEKVKEFLHNIKRYLLGVFGDDQKWVTNYEKELLALDRTSLKDYKIKMYNYTLDSLDSLSITYDDSIIKETERVVNQIIGNLMGGHKNDKYSDDALTEYFEKRYDELMGTIDADGEDDIDKAIWSYYRDGATNENDKEEVEVAPNIKSWISAIKAANKTITTIDNAETKSETKYKKAIKFIDDMEKRVSDVDTSSGRVDVKKSDLYKNDKKTAVYNVDSTMVSQTASTLREYSSYMSKEQSFFNKMITGYKSCIVERNKAYKKALVGAFGYSRKNSKKK